MNNIDVRLILCNNGDIEIRVYLVGCGSHIYYYKSYNMGDKLEDNLLKAFKTWEKLRDSLGEIEDGR